MIAVKGEVEILNVGIKLISPEEIVLQKKTIKTLHPATDSQVIEISPSGDKESQQSSLVSGGEGYPHITRSDEKVLSPGPGICDYTSDSKLETNLDEKDTIKDEEEHQIKSQDERLADAAAEKKGECRYGTPSKFFLIFAHQVN